MASSGKKKTTMAKLNRESKLRERRRDKQARKDARKFAAANPDQATDTLTGDPNDTLTADLSDTPTVDDSSEPAS